LVRLDNLIAAFGFPGWEPSFARLHNRRAWGFQETGRYESISYLHFTIPNHSMFVAFNLITQLFCICLCLFFNLQLATRFIQYLHLLIPLLLQPDDIATGSKIVRGIVSRRGLAPDAILRELVTVCRDCAEMLQEVLRPVVKVGLDLAHRDGITPSVEKFRKSYSKLFGTADMGRYPLFHALLHLAAAMQDMGPLVHIAEDFLETSHWIAKIVR
jgi:hypothetical protein